MKHQPKIVFHSYGDSFPDSPQFVYEATLHFANRRLCRSQKKRAGDPDTNEPLTNDARFQRSDVGNDIRQFRHLKTLRKPRHRATVREGTLRGF
jgi:hypothetical protein